MDIKRCPPGGGDPPKRADGLSRAATAGIVTRFPESRFAVRPEPSIATGIHGWSVLSLSTLRRVQWYADESRARRRLDEATRRWSPFSCTPDCPWCAPLAELQSDLRVIAGEAS